MVRVANEAPLSVLDEQANLPRPAADAVVAARPIASLAALDEVRQVGPTALAAILKFAQANGYTSSCGTGETPQAELGIISDLDDTVIPKARPDMSKPPFPGVRPLYRLLEDRRGGRPGDVYYVTAREPERVTEVPAYLARHGVPPGPIETGTSGAPFVARPGKVRDIESIFARTGTQKFVFFGDTTHVDPDVQRDILARHPERMVAGIILQTTQTVAPERLVGLHLVQNYAEAAAVLFKLGAITRAEALGVMEEARDQGLALTTDTMTRLLASP